MTRTSLLALIVLALLGVAGLAFADEPAPAPAPATPATPAAGQADANTDAVVAFFEALATLAESNQADCALMGGSLNDYLDQNDKVLRDAAYTASVAPAEQELAITNAATRLGEAAGLCYTDANVVRFFERFTTLAAELDK